MTSQPRERRSVGAPRVWNKCGLCHTGAQLSVEDDRHDIFRRRID